MRVHINTVLLIFAFNRPKHTLRLLNSLSLNREVFEIPIIFFIDGPRNSLDRKNICEVKNVINEFKKKNKSIEVISRKQNLGCKENIFSGVTELLEKYDSAIVLEDDLIIDQYFLKYMLDALRIYASCKKVFHISGYSFIDNNCSKKAIFSRFMNCWGWATWSDRWQFLNKDVSQIKKGFSRKDIYEFNIEGSHDFFRQIIENDLGIINTWAIFWYATIFKLNGLCLTPINSLVKNEGRDGSGERNGGDLNKVIFKNFEINDFPENIEEDLDYFLKLKSYFNQKENFLKFIIKKIIYFLPAKFQKQTFNQLNLIRIILKNLMKKIIKKIIFFNYL